MNEPLRLRMSSWVFVLEKMGEEERKSDLVLQVNLWSSPGGKGTKVSQSHSIALGSIGVHSLLSASVSSLLQHHHSEYLNLYIFSVIPL